MMQWATSYVAIKVVESTTKFSPNHDVDALKSTFSSKPLLFAPRAGNEFATTSSVIHDLNKEDNHYYQFLMDAQGLFSIVDHRLNREARILSSAIQEVRAIKKAA